VGSGARVAESHLPPALSPRDDPDADSAGRACCDDPANH
jgi:hypothetical protein